MESEIKTGLDINSGIKIFKNLKKLNSRRRKNGNRTFKTFRSLYSTIGNYDTFRIQKISKNMRSLAIDKIYSYKLKNDGNYFKKPPLKPPINTHYEPPLRGGLIKKYSHFLISY